MSNTKDMKSFDIGISTNTGIAGQGNENYSASFECINGEVFIVCDGVGYHGTVATKLATESIRAYLENHYFDMPEDALRAAIEFANSVVYRKAKEIPEYSGMGASIVMAVVRYDKVHYAHVGNSRIYIFSEDKLHMLTRNNTVVSALGLSTNIEIDICTTAAIPAMDDIFMFCTEGLTNLLNETEIKEVLIESLQVHEKAAKLIQLAKEKNESVYMSALLIHFNRVANKKSKFAFAYQPPKEFKPFIKEEETKPAENIKEIDDVKESIKESIIKRIGFVEKLKEKPDLKHKIRIAAIVLLVLFLAFVVWDLFIKQSSYTKISNLPNNSVDSTKNKDNDSVAKQNQLPAKPDTIWINYSIKKGDLLGKISSKFHVPLSFIKEKNKLKSDMIAEKQQLQIPTKANHTVLANETLEAIAQKYQTDKNSILKANDIKDEKNIKTGKDLIIPF